TVTFPVAPLLHVTVHVNVPPTCTGTSAGQLALVTVIDPDCKLGLFSIPCSTCCWSTVRLGGAVVVCDADEDEDELLELPHPARPPSAVTINRHGTGERRASDISGSVPSQPRRAKPVAQRRRRVRRQPE